MFYHGLRGPDVPPDVVFRTLEGALAASLPSTFALTARAKSGSAGDSSGSGRGTTRAAATNASASLTLKGISASSSLRASSVPPLSSSSSSFPPSSSSSSSSSSAAAVASRATASTVIDLTDPPSVSLPFSPLETTATKGSALFRDIKEVDESELIDFEAEEEEEEEAEAEEDEEHEDHGDDDMQEEMGAATLSNKAAERGISDDDEAKQKRQMKPTLLPLPPLQRSRKRKRAYTKNESQAAWSCLQDLLLSPGRLAWLTAYPKSLSRVPVIRNYAAQHLLHRGREATYPFGSIDGSSESLLGDNVTKKRKWTPEDSRYLAAMLRVWSLLTDLAWTNGMGFDKTEVHQILDWATAHFLPEAKGFPEPLSLVASVCAANSLALNDIIWTKYCTHFGKAFLSQKRRGVTNASFVKMAVLFHLRDFAAVAALMAGDACLAIAGFSTLDYLPRLRSAFLMHCGLSPQQCSDELWSLPIVEPIPSIEATAQIDVLYCVHAILSTKQHGIELSGGQRWLQAQLEAVRPPSKRGEQLPLLLIPMLRLWAKACPRLAAPDRKWIISMIGSFTSDASSKITDAEHEAAGACSNQRRSMLLRLALLAIFLLNMAAVERERLQSEVPFMDIALAVQDAVVTDDLYFDVLGDLQADIARAFPEFFLPFSRSLESPRKGDGLYLSPPRKWTLWLEKMQTDDDVGRALKCASARHPKQTMLWATAHLFQSVGRVFKSSYEDLCHNPLQVLVPLQDITRHPEREKLLWIIAKLIRYFAYAFEARLFAKFESATNGGLPAEAAAFLETQRTAMRLILADAGLHFQSNMLKSL